MVWIYPGGGVPVRRQRERPTRDSSGQEHERLSGDVHHTHKWVHENLNQDPKDEALERLDQPESRNKELKEHSGSSENQNLL